MQGNKTTSKGTAMYDVNFSTIANEMGKTTSEKKVIDALSEWIGGIENAISNGETTCDELGFHTTDNIKAAGNIMVVSSFDKRTLSHVTPERLSEFVDYFADSFEYADELDNATSPEANNDEENTMTASTTNSNTFYGSAANMPYNDFVEGLFMFANKWVGEIAVDRIASRAESLYNDMTFRVMVHEYRQACLAQRDIKKRMFENIASGDTLYNASDWDTSIYNDRVQAYGEVLYDLFVTLPRRAEDERESVKKLG